MPDPSYRYVAFISYSHMDKEFAHELQQYLEGYQLPAVLCGKYPDAPRDVRPVFRDEENLSAGVLHDKLKSALRQSRYLIVICSENSAHPNREGNHYVNDEVYHFLGSRPEESSQRIIPIIHRESRELNPKACMPPMLRVLDILGIDALSKGKERCFNDVVASMLHIDPLVLWEYRKRPENPRQRVGAHWSGKLYSYTAALCHAREDAPRALALQRYLAEYRLLPEFRRRFPELPENLLPLYVEQAEPNAPAPPPAEEALPDTGYLIILCTPAAAASPEVEARIRLFLGEKPEERLPRLIPLIYRPFTTASVQECLPPLLRGQELPFIPLYGRAARRGRHRLVAALLNYNPDFLPPNPDVEALFKGPTESQLVNIFKTMGYIYHNMFRYQARACRQEFWMGMLALVAVILMCFCASSNFLEPVKHEMQALEYRSVLVGVFCVALFFLIGLIFISLLCRRLHDLNLSGWWMLLYLPGFYDGLAFLVLAILTILIPGFIKGKAGKNRFGYNHLSF